MESFGRLCVKCQLCGEGGGGGVAQQLNGKYNLVQFGEGEKMVISPETISEHWSPAPPPPSSKALSPLCRTPGGSGHRRSPAGWPRREERPARKYGAAPGLVLRSSEGEVSLAGRGNPKGGGGRGAGGGGRGASVKKPPETQSSAPRVLVPGLCRLLWTQCSPPNVPIA